MDRTKSYKNISPRQGEVKILIAGAGGQGILLLGRVLAQALLSDGKEVSWLPSYGAEVRGGTCKCMLVTSDEEISSPYVFHPDYLLVMNEPSYKKYVPALAPEGIVFYNRTLIPQDILDADISNIAVAATDIALDCGEIKTANMVMLGAFARHSGIVELEGLSEAFPLFIRRREILELDREAIRRGYEYF